MSPSSDDFVLPKEAQELVDQVDALGRAAEQIRQNARAELHEIKSRGEEEVRQLAKTYHERKEALELEERQIKRRIKAEQEELEARQAAFEAIVEQRLPAAGIIADAWADYERARAEALASALEEKDRPALVAADAVREKGEQLAKVRREAKLAQYLVTLYETHFPWLPELRDIDEEEAYVEGETAEEREPAAKTDDPAARWLTQEEWQALSSAERSQRALERYLRSRKSLWQVGRDYERYIGYLRERDGYTVTYHGIAKGLEDLGRDVIAERDGAIEVIQCKRWSRAKRIHEKHIFQLYGTVVLAQIENPGKGVRGTFTTTTTLSPVAREVAQFLEISVEEDFPLEDYPRIKCNIARDSGERIYHLPFDQQYDSTLIEPERGEAYAFTAAEAEEAGFRRAWRWRAGKA